MELSKDRRNRKKPNLDLSAMVYGKVPPQAKDVEEVILGAMLIEPATILDVREVLKPEDFYADAHQKICKAIYAVSEHSNADIILVVEYLKSVEDLDLIGGAYAVVKLTNSVTSTTNLRRHCLIVKEASIKRRLINFAGLILSDAYENTNDVFDLLVDAENELKGINFELSELKVTPISTVAMNVIEHFDDKIYKAKNNIIDERTVYTGIREWDEINGSLFGGLYVIAGRPAMGKGVHMTELICRMAKNVNVGVINGEMTDEQLLTRVGCNLLGIDNFLFKKNPKYVTEEEQQQLKDAMNEAIQLKLHIENSKYINKIASKIKLWVERYNVRCVLADFLTLFKVPEEMGKYFTATQRVDYVLDVFASLCKDLKIPIILYVQMNREILGRHGSKEPNLGDLKQSGSIEELAYQVSFLHRPEYYDESAIVDDLGESTKGLMYQIIAKHRDGKVGRIKHRAILQCSQLKDWTDGSSDGWKPNAPF